MSPQHPVRIADVLRHVDVHALQNHAANALAAGRDRATVIREIVALVDAAIPWSEIIPSPIGVALEAVDAPIATAIATMIVDLAQLFHKRPHART